MAWGGWVEADAIRCEIALLMIHSYIGYAHASVARLTLASRMVDDFVNKFEMFGSGTKAASTGSSSAARGRASRTRRDACGRMTHE